MRTFLRNIVPLVLTLVVAMAAAESGPSMTFEAGKYSTDASATVSCAGTVLENFNNELLVVRSEPSLVLVTIDKRFWSQSLRSGDEISVRGRLDTRTVEQNTVVAEEITLTRRTNTPSPLPIRTIGELQALKEGEPVAVVARVEPTAEGTEVKLIDATGSIAFDRGPRARGGLVTFAPDAAYVALGIVQKRYNGTYIRGASLQPTTAYFRGGEGLPVRSIRYLNAKKAIGRQVRTNGNLIHFEGDRQLPVLIDGDEVLVVYLAPNQVDLDHRIGGRVGVIGVYDTEEIKGKTYGVVHDARIVPAERRVPRIAGVKIPLP